MNIFYRIKIVLVTLEGLVLNSAFTVIIHSHFIPVSVPSLTHVFFHQFKFLVGRVCDFK